MRCARDFEQTLAHAQNVYEVYYRPYGGRHIGNSKVDSPEIVTLRQDRDRDFSLPAVPASPASSIFS